MMKSTFQRTSRILALALATGFPAAARAWAPACSAPAASSCAGGYEQALADTGGDQFSTSPYDLGEGAPAQTGYDLAINSPNMIGDLLSGGGYILSSYTDGLSTIPIAGGDRRFKISENMSPLPRDRVYYAFNGFQQGARTIDGSEIDVNRHTLGGEKTFWEAAASVEVRMPILQGLSAVQTLDGNLSNDDRVEFGNMTIIPKFVISDGPGHVLSAGLGVNLPTARDASLAQGGTNSFRPFLNIDNQSVHLSPFLGLLLLPNDDIYVISFVQADFDTYGSTVSDINGYNLGRYQEQTLVHLDVAVGRYLYRNYGSRLSGIAAQLELHYSTTIQDSDQVDFGPFTIGNPYNRIDLLIMTAGVNFQFWDSSWLTVGCAVPVRGSNQDTIYNVHPERPFDAEIQVLFNRYF